MNLLDVETESGLTAREFPAGLNCLRCQLGEVRQEWRVSRGGADHRPYKRATRIFHLRAYGTTWSDALRMFQRTHPTPKPSPQLK